MPVKRLKDFLDNNHIKYVLIAHSRAIPAQEVAESAHISGQQLAKAVIVKLDGKLAMVVLPATLKVDLGNLKKLTGVNNVEMATESEFNSLFPDCEVGAMPPFGNLFGIEVYMDNKLSKEKEIAFNAGSHSECMKLAFSDYAKLVNPKIMM